MARAEARGLARAIRQRSRDLIEQADRGAEYAIVRDSNPLTLELTDSRLVLEEDDVVIPHAVESEVVAGETALLLPLRDGDWCVISVPSYDPPPEPSVVIDVTRPPYNVAGSTTDNTAAINQAIQDAAVAEPTLGLSGNDLGAKIVQLPPGWVGFDGPMRPVAGVWVRGHGPQGTKLRKRGGVGNLSPMIDTTGPPWTASWKFSDFSLINNESGADSIHCTGGGPSALGDVRGVFRDIVIVGGNRGVVSPFSEGQGNELRLFGITTVRTKSHGFDCSTTDGFLLECTAQEAGTGAAPGVAVYGFNINGNNWRIGHCKAFGQHGSNGAGFIYTSRNIAYGCEAQDCEGWGFIVNDNGVLIVGCEADSCGQGGFNLGGNVLMSGCLALNRSGLYTMPRAVRVASGGPTYGIPSVRGLRTHNVPRITATDPTELKLFAQATCDIDNRYGTEVVPYAATITPDPWMGEVKQIGTLTGNLTVAAPTTAIYPSGGPTPPANAYPHGMKLRFMLIADTSARTITFNAAFQLADGGSTISLAASATTIVEFSWNADLAKWVEARDRTSKEEKLGLAATPDALVTGAITRDANGAATSAAVTWPDGTPGQYTATSVSTAFPGAVDAYTITYGSPVRRTYTQSAVTRDPTTGAVTNRPPITVS